MRILLLIALSFILISCKGEDGETVYVTVNPGSPNYTTLTGKFQDGFCLSGATVISKPLDDNFIQNIIGHYISQTTDNRGNYNFPVDFSSNYAEVFSDIPCRSELTGAMMAPKRLSSIINLNVDSPNNITPLTTMRSPVAKNLRWLGNDTESSLIEAERLILSYAGMPKLNTRFTNMSIENNSTADSVLLAINSALLLGRNEVEQIDFMQKISQDIIAGTEVYKAEFRQNIKDLPIVRIKNNLEAMHLALGESMDIPPFWRVTRAPYYYTDLLERTPIVTGTSNLDDNTYKGFDQSTYNTFAVPRIFDSSIEISKYVAWNFPPNSEISIWTIGVDNNGNPAPGSKLIDILGLDSIILDNPVKLSYNGLLPDNHGLTGIEYYIVIRKDSNFVLSKSSGGRRLYTNYTLASNDEGASWIGHNNNADRFFYFEGIKEYTTN